MEDYSNASLEGDMSVTAGNRSNAPIGAPDFNTLDEPIKQTIVSLFQIFVIIRYMYVCMPIIYSQLRDIRAVGVKFYHVLYPKEKSTLLKDCK